MVWCRYVVVWSVMVWHGLGRGLFYASVTIATCLSTVSSVLRVFNSPSRGSVVRGGEGQDGKKNQKSKIKNQKKKISTLFLLPTPQFPFLFFFFFFSFFLISLLFSPFLLSSLAVPLQFCILHPTSYLHRTCHSSPSQLQHTYVFLLLPTHMYLHTYLFTSFSISV